jgi:hypothetical protein
MTLYLQFYSAVYDNAPEGRFCKICFTPCFTTTGQLLGLNSDLLANAGLSLLGYIVGSDKKFFGFVPSSYLKNDMQKGIWTGPVRSQDMEIWFLYSLSFPILALLVAEECFPTSQRNTCDPSSPLETRRKERFQHGAEGKIQIFSCIQWLFFLYFKTLYPIAVTAGVLDLGTMEVVTYAYTPTTV